MKRLAITAAVILALTSAPMAQRGTTPKPLDIYVVDTEGGKAALWVAPSGQSLLIDSGNPGNRDLDRIMYSRRIREPTSTSSWGAAATRSRGSRIRILATCDLRLATRVRLRLNPPRRPALNW